MEEYLKKHPIRIPIRVYIATIWQLRKVDPQQKWRIWSTICKRQSCDRYWINKKALDRRIRIFLTQTHLDYERNPIQFKVVITELDIYEQHIQYEWK